MIPQLDPQESAFLDSVRDYCREHVAPVASQWDRDEAIPLEVFRDCAGRGLMGICAKTEDGGHGRSMLLTAMTLEEVARYSGALALDLAAMNTLCIAQVLDAGDSEQRAQVQKVISGEWMIAWGLTEINAGSDTSGMTTVAEENGDGVWSITGNKMYITQGGNADYLIVMAVTGDRDGGRKEISAFTVLRDQVQVVRKIPLYGVRASETHELRFDGAEGKLLGEKGRGQANALRMLDAGRIGVAAVACGLGRAGFEDAQRFASERIAFGKSIDSFQMVQADLADCAVELEAARLMTWKAASLYDRGEPFGLQASMAKLYSSEVGVAACNRGMNIMGGRGYDRDHEMERYLRDVKICEIGEGSSNIQRMVIARHLKKKS